MTDGGTLLPTGLASGRSRALTYPLAGLGAAFALYACLQILFGRLPLLDLGFGRAPVPAGIFAYGAVVGSLYALVAFGLILTYRANRAINFAQAGMGAVPAVGALVLVFARGWPFFAALAAAVVVALALGAVIERQVIRPFEHSPRLVVSVATIGLSLLLAFFEIKVPGWLAGDLLTSVRLDTPFSTFTFDIGEVRFTGDALFTVVVVILTMVWLRWFLLRTSVGLTARAMAENGDRAAGLGLAVRGTSMTIWGVAAALSTIGIFLRAGLVGVPIGSSIGPAVLLLGLIAAVIARMDSFAVALVAAVGIGVVDQVVVFSTRNSAATYAVMFAVLVAVLFFQRNLWQHRAGDDAGGFQSSDDSAPMPRIMRGLPEVRALRTAGWVLGIAITVSAPWWLGPGRESLAGRFAILAMVGVSLVMLTGWAGQVSLGQFGFVGVGAGVAGSLVTRFDTDFFVVLVIAAAAGALLAVLVGLPALWTRGMFLAVTTLAFGFAVQFVLLNRDYVPWLLPERGAFVERPVLFGSLSTADDRTFYWLTLLFLAATIGFARALRRSHAGQKLIAARDNPLAAKAFAIEINRARLVTFAVSGGIAAIAGALLAYQRGSVDASGYGPLQSVDVFVMTVIGGISSVGGAIAGAVVVLLVPVLPWLENFDEVQLLTTSLGLLFVLSVLPGGLMDAFHQVRDSLLRVIARRRGLSVPELSRGDRDSVEVPDVVSLGADTDLGVIGTVERDPPEGSERELERSGR